MKFIAKLLICFELLLLVRPLFAIDGDLQSELLSRMSLREHFETTLSTREQERYDLERELEELSSGPMAQSPHAARRISEINTRLAVVEQSISRTQQQLLDADSRLADARQRALTAPQRQTEQDISVYTSAAGLAYTQAGYQAARDLPLAFQGNATPTTGVVARQGNVTTSIEQWRDGNFYRVNRYTEGPNQGRFAEGGRQRLSDAEVRQMGGQLRTQHVDGLRTNLSASEARLDGLRGELRQAQTAQQRADIQSRIDQQTRTQQELRTELKRMEARPVRDFLVSGASFAAMSVAIQASFNIISQTVANDGDLSKVDLAQATAFVTEASFWRDLSGTYFGGMAGRALTAFLPGPFRILGTIAGGTIGAQLVSGRWREADWAMLGAQTIGSTVGYLLGAFIGSLMGPLAPIAIIAFSIAGAWLAEKALEWIRGVFSAKISGTRARTSDLTDSETANIFREALDTSDAQELEALSTEQLRERLWQSHTDMMAFQQAGANLQSDGARTEWERLLSEKMQAHERVRRVLDKRRMTHFEYVAAQ